MYYSSTQKKSWKHNESQLSELRRSANNVFVDLYRDNEDSSNCQFLSPSEELILCQVVEEMAQKFCAAFKPPMPDSVMTVAITYFKRFYLRNSVMEHIAKNIMLACMYLATKVEEFNVSLEQFVDNLQSGVKVDNTEIILNYEPEVLHQLQYHLFVHTPFRALEGFIIDMKQKKIEPYFDDEMRKKARTFLVKSLLTDVCLKYAPSQIALAAVRFSTVSEAYCTAVLGEHEQSGDNLLQRIKDIQNEIESHQYVDRQEADAVMSKFGIVISVIRSKSVCNNDKVLHDDFDSDEDVPSKRLKE